MHRLYVKSIFVGYKRSKHTQRPHTSLLKIEGVENRSDTTYYMGKRVAFVYRGHRKTKQRGDKKPSKYRVNWGRVMRPHGNSGIVRAKFRHNLPAKAMGATMRVVRSRLHGGREGRGGMWVLLCLCLTSFPSPLPPSLILFSR